MRFSFATDDLADLYVSGSNKYHPNLIRAYRRVIDVIAAAHDERTLRGMKGLRMEKLHGDRDGQYSVREMINSASSFPSSGMMRAITC